MIVSKGQNERYITKCTVVENQSHCNFIRSYHQSTTEVVKYAIIPASPKLKNQKVFQDLKLELSIDTHVEYRDSFSYVRSDQAQSWSVGQNTKR